MDREKAVKDNAIRGLQSAIEISGALVHLRKEHAKAILALLKEQDTKTGYWITEEPNTYTRRTYCSVCSKSAPFVYVSDDYYGGRSHGETKKTKYCPNCGAKMNI